MSVPSRAKLEAVLSDDVALWDASRVLPVHPRRGPYPSRPGAVRHLPVHKSGGDGPPGFRGLLGSTRFVIHERGWHGCAYHHWLSREPDRDAEGRMVVYRGQPSAARSWHTGGRMNGLGESIALQGRYDGEWDLLGDDPDSPDPRIEREPTDAQVRMLEVLLPYLAELHGLQLDSPDGPLGWVLTGHWEHGKPVCPGDFTRRWVMVRRGQIVAPGADEPVGEETAGERARREALQESPWSGRCPSPREVQEALRSLGHDPGPVDGAWGMRSRAALERYQAARGLKPDGWLGPRTLRALGGDLGPRDVASSAGAPAAESSVPPPTSARDEEAGAPAEEDDEPEDDVDDDG